MAWQLLWRDRHLLNQYLVLHLWKTKITVNRELSSWCQESHKVCVCGCVWTSHASKHEENIAVQSDSKEDYGTICTLVMWCMWSGTPPQGVDSLATGLSEPQKICSTRWRFKSSWIHANTTKLYFHHVGPLSLSSIRFFVSKRFKCCQKV